MKKRFNFSWKKNNPEKSFFNIRAYFCKKRIVTFKFQVLYFVPFFLKAIIFLAGRTRISNLRHLWLSWQKMEQNLVKCTQHTGALQLEQPFWQDDTLFVTVQKEDLVKKLSKIIFSLIFNSKLSQLLKIWPWFRSYFPGNSNWTGFIRKATSRISQIRRIY